jgi:hypothetical protein
VNLKHEDIDHEPFMLRKRSAKEIADYDAGFAAGSNAQGVDDSKGQSWQRGWAEAQE